MRALSGARSRTRKPPKKCYRGLICTLTKDEIKKLWFRDKAHLLKYPSLDRKDSRSGYYYENCRFIELYENCTASCKPKKVKQIDKYGNVVKIWSSISRIITTLGIKKGRLHDVLYHKNYRKTVRGYRWVIVE